MYLLIVCATSHMSRFYLYSSEFCCCFPFFSVFVSIHSFFSYENCIVTWQMCIQIRSLTLPSTAARSLSFSLLHLLHFYIYSSVFTFCCVCRVLLLFIIYIAVVAIKLLIIYYYSVCLPFETIVFMQFT